MRVRVIENPNDEPINLEKAKAFLRLDVIEDEELELVETMISAARENARRFKGVPSLRKR